MTMVKLFFAFVVLIHGLIHMMGFAKAFGYGDMKSLLIPISKPVGMVWFFTTWLFVVGAVLLLVKNEWWWKVLMVSVVLSQFVIVMSWGDAKFGTVANILILLPVTYALIQVLPGSFPNRYKDEVTRRLIPVEQNSTLTEQDIAHLPALVQKYLRFTGNVGKPKIYNVRLNGDGLMKLKEDEDWVTVRSQQHNFFSDSPVRLYYISSSLFGLPFDGLHVYTEQAATMQIKVAGVYQIVDAKGEKMDQSETVTLFNDMCLIAPATLIDPAIQWKEIDESTVEAVFNNLGHTITARLVFDDSGAMMNFISNDRYLSADGKTYENYPWSTPVKDYQEFDGRKLAVKGEAIWHKPMGDYVYGKFTLREVEYNVTDFKYESS